MRMKRIYLGALLGLGLWACEAPPPGTDTTFDELEAVNRCAGQPAKAPTLKAQREMAELVATQRLSPDDCGEFAELLQMVSETEAMLDEGTPFEDYVQLEPEAGR